MLQAHRRFTGPALAPLVSSLVMIVAYLVFDQIGDGGPTTWRISPRRASWRCRSARPIAAAAMVLTVIGPVARLGLRLRPSLVLPAGRRRPGAAARDRGHRRLIAQQLALIVVVRLANELGGKGAVGVYNYAWALYQLPFAVLAVPIATSSFPVLSARAADGDTAGFDGLTASTTRVILLVTGLAAGVMAAVAVPVARVFLEGTPGGGARGDGQGRHAFRARPGRIRASCSPRPGPVRLRTGAGRPPRPRWPDGGSRSWPRSCSPTPPTARRTWWGNWRWAARSA